MLNVMILRNWRTRKPLTSADSALTEALSPWDHALGAVGFILAGCAFIALSMCAGFAALTAGGVDFAVPDTEAERVRLLAALTWWPGLAAAVAGLIMWIRQARRGRSIILWASADLTLQLVLLTVLILAW
jgi:hypothetical protein